MHIYVGIRWNIEQVLPHRYHLSVVETPVEDISDCRLWLQNFWKRYFRLVRLLQIVTQCNRPRWQHAHICRNQMEHRTGIAAQISSIGCRDTGTRYFRLPTLTAELLEKIFQTSKAVANCHSVQPPSMTTCTYMSESGGTSNRYCRTDIIYRLYRHR